MGKKFKRNQKTFTIEQSLFDEPVKNSGRLEP